ncbi:MAG: hypothetical protein HY589_02585 [Candidatus Omnitrophica bacterium]|nr:hypothetical protein [Candidatus Omnitrophota bacterium]
MKKEPREIIGLDISEGRLSAAVTRPGAGWGITGFFSEQIPEYKTDEELSGIIKDFFVRNRLFKKEVRLNIGLASEDIIFSRVSLPVMPQHEVPNALRWHMKDKTSLDINKAGLAFERVCEYEGQDGSKKADIMLTMADASFIGRFLGVFKNCGIPLGCITVTPFSLSNILKMDRAFAQKKEPVLICHVGLNSTYICVYQEGRLALVRRIPLAVSSFINAVTGVIISDNGRIELTRADADKIFNDFGIPRESDRILDGRVPSAQVIAMVRPVVERFVGEISRSIEYYKREFKAGIGRILLTGEAARIKGLDGYILKWTNIKAAAPQLPDGVSPEGAACLGAAVAHKGAINLLPEDIRRDAQADIRKTVLRLSTAAALTILFLSFIAVSIQIAGLKNQLALINKQKEMLRDFKETQDRIKPREAIIEGVKDSEADIGLLLKELSNITPGNIAFWEIRVSQKQAAVVLKGRVRARPEAVQSILSDFMEGLERSVLLKEAELYGLERDDAAGDVSIFEIGCSLDKHG